MHSLLFSDSECDELDTRSDEQYWQTKVSRVVKSDGTYLSHIRPKETSRQAQTISSADVNLVVLQKLERYLMLLYSGESGLVSVSLCV